MPRSRTRRIANWTGLVVIAVLMLAQVVGNWWSFQWSSDHLQIRLAGGAFAVTHVLVTESGHATVTLESWTGHHGWNAGRPGTWRWWFEFGTIALDPGTSVWIITLPLWVPLLAIAIPTAWLWRRDRRHPPGRCRKCGYDLTGNVTGVCSECATETEGVNAPG